MIQIHRLLSFHSRNSSHSCLTADRSYLITDRSYHSQSCRWKLGLQRIDQMRSKSYDWLRMGLQWMRSSFGWQIRKGLKLQCSSSEQQFRKGLQ